MNGRALLTSIVVGGMLALVACGGAASTSQGGSTATAKPTAGAAAAAPAPAAGQPVKGGTLTIGFGGEPDTLDPAKTGDTISIEMTHDVFATLLWQNQDGSVSPYLATSYSVSPDGKTYTLQLRKDVTFQDGTPFNAQAVVANFAYITNPKTNSFGALGSLGSCTKAAATGTYQVTITCTKPDSQFLHSLAGFAVQSPTAIAQYPKIQPVGAGPFRIVSWTHGSNVVLQRYAKYDWAPAAVGRNGPAYLDKIVYDFVTSDQARVEELQTGQAQLIYAPALAYKTLKGNPSYQEMEAPIAGAGYYTPMNEIVWPTNDKAVRQAISYAVNKAGVIQLADQGVYAPTWGPLQKGTIGYDPQFNNMYAYDPAKAAQLLTADGWQKVNGIWTKGGKQLTLTIQALNSGDSVAICQAIQGYLQKAGMVVKIETVAGTAWWSNMLNSKVNMAPLQFSSTSPDVMRLEFTPGQQFNFDHYNNPKVTALLEGAVTQIDPQKALSMYTQAEQMIMNDAVVLPLRFNANLIIMSKGLQGVVDDAGGNLSYYSAWLSPK